MNEKLEMAKNSLYNANEIKDIKENPEGIKFFYPETGVCRNYGKIRMWKDDTFETIGYDRPSDRRKAVL